MPREGLPEPASKHGRELFVCVHAGKLCTEEFNLIAARSLLRLLGFWLLLVVVNLALVLCFALSLSLAR